MIFYEPFGNEFEGFHHAVSVGSALSKCDISRKYFMTYVVNMDIYHYALNEFAAGKLAWKVGDYVMHPAMAFAKDGYVLPITFEGFDIDEMVKGKVCTYARAFYRATR